MLAVEEVKERCLLLVLRPVLVSVFFSGRWRAYRTPEQLGAGGEGEAGRVSGQVHWPGWFIKTVPRLWLCTVFSNCSEFDFQGWILFM